MHVSDLHKIESLIRRAKATSKNENKNTKTGVGNDLSLSLVNVEGGAAASGHQEKDSLFSLVNMEAPGSGLFPLLVATHSDDRGMIGEGHDR
jgi:hypothetical protein